MFKVGDAVKFSDADSVYTVREVQVILDGVGGVDPSHLSLVSPSVANTLNTQNLREKLFLKSAYKAKDIVNDFKATLTEEKIEKLFSKACEKGLYEVTFNADELAIAFPHSLLGVQERLQILIQECSDVHGLDIHEDIHADRDNYDLKVYNFSRKEKE